MSDKEQEKLDTTQNNIDIMRVKVDTARKTNAFYAGKGKDKEINCPFCGGKIQVFSMPCESHPFVSSKDKWYGQCRKCRMGIGRTRRTNLLKALKRRAK